MSGQSVAALKEAVAKEAATASPGQGEAKDAGKDGVKQVTMGHARPVVIHRAIAGSIERFVGILTEHFAGKWPFWMSPRQVLIVPVTPKFYDYGQEVRKILHKEKIYVDVDVSGDILKKKIRTGRK